jgi:hypothetical protein
VDTGRRDGANGGSRRLRGLGVAVAIAVALVACVLAVVAISDDGDSPAAPLRWTETQRIPDSRLIEIPNSYGHEMGILDPQFRATAVDSEGKLSYGVVATLWMDAGSPMDDGRARCSISAPDDAERAEVGVGHLFGGSFTAGQGISARQLPPRKGKARFEWPMPSKAPDAELELRFAAVWTTSSTPAARIACSLTTEDGTVAVRTGGILSGQPTSGPGGEG